MKANNNKKKIILIIGIMLFGLLLLSSPNIFAKVNPDEQKPSTTLTKLIIQNYLQPVQCRNIWYPRILLRYQFTQKC